MIDPESEEEEKKRRDSEWLTELEEEIFSGLDEGEGDEEKPRSDYDVFHDCILNRTEKAITKLEQKKLEQKKLEEEEKKKETFATFGEELDKEEAETVVDEGDACYKTISEVEEEPDWLEEWEQMVAEGKWSDIIIPTPPKLPSCTVPEMFKFHHAYGYDCQKYFNLFLLSEYEVIYTTGMVAAIFNVRTGETVFLLSTADTTVAHVAVNPRIKHIAIAEKGTDPKIIIYDWPSLKILQVLCGGTEKAYAVIGYNPTGSTLLSHGKMPDRTVSLWDWRNGVSYCNNYKSNEGIMNLTFRRDNNEQYMVCGRGPIAGWTFRSKGESCLQKISTPSIADVSDHLCFDFITEECYVTGNSLGCIVVWLDWKFYAQASVAPSIPCHPGAIVYIHFRHEDNTVYTVGEDGFVRVWDVVKIMGEREKNFIRQEFSLFNLQEDERKIQKRNKRKYALLNVAMEEVKAQKSATASMAGKEEEEEGIADGREVEDNDDDNPEDDEVEEQPLWLQERRKRLLQCEDMNFFSSDLYDISCRVNVNYLRQKDLGEGIAKIQPRCLVKRFPSDDENFDFFVQDALGYIWEVNTFDYRKKSRRYLCFQKGPVADIATSPCDPYMVTLGRNGRMLFYNYDRKKLILVKLSRVGARCLLWLPLFVDRTGKVLIVGCSDGVMRVYVASLQELEKAPRHVDPLSFLNLIQATKVHSKRFTAMSINQMGTLLVTASKDQTVWMHRFDHRTEYATVLPIGFINLPWTTYSFTWKPFAVHTVLCCYYNSQVVELNLTEAAPHDPDISYELDNVHVRTIIAKSGKSQFLRNIQIAEYNRIKKEELETKLEEWKAKVADDPEFRVPKSKFIKSKIPPLKLDPLYVPEKPSRIYFARYIGPNDVWISFGDYDTGFMCEFTFGEVDSINVCPIADATECGIHCCIQDPTGKFLILGMEDGKVRVCRYKHVDHRDLSDYWSFTPHDIEYGSVTHLIYSYDKKFLFTCGLDGGVFSFYADPPPVPVPQPRTRVRLGKPRHIIEDIDGHSILSLEEQKKMSIEEDRSVRGSARSQKIRKMLMLYRERVKEIMKEDSKFGILGYGVRRQMDVPKCVRNASVHRLSCIEKCIWRAHRKRTAYYKPFAEIIQNMWGDVELQMFVSALGKPEVKAATFYQTHLGKDFDEAMEKAKERLKRESKRGSKPPPPPPPEEIETDFDEELMNMKFSISEQPPQWLMQEVEPHKSHPKIKQALKKFIEYKRSKRLFELKAAEIRSNIVELVQRQDECVSDAESESDVIAENYPFPRREDPTVAKKLLEYLEIRKKMVEIKQKFNKRVYVLRHEKLGYLEKLVPLYVNLYSIQKELNEECVESYPAFPMIDWRNEYPELTTEFSEEKLEEIFFPQLAEWKKRLQREERTDEVERAKKTGEKKEEGAVAQEMKQKAVDSEEETLKEDEEDEESQDEQTEIDNKEESGEKQVEQTFRKMTKEEIRKKSIEIRNIIKSSRRAEEREAEETCPHENLYESVLARPLKKPHPYLKMLDSELSPTPKVEQWIDAFDKCFNEHAFDHKTLQRLIARGACKVERFVLNIKGDDFWNPLFPRPNLRFSGVCKQMRDCIEKTSSALHPLYTISKEDIDAEEDKKNSPFILPSQLLQIMNEGGLPVRNILSAMKKGTFQLEDYLTLVQEEKEMRRREKQKKAGEEKTVHFEGDDLGEVATRETSAVETITDDLDGEGFTKLTLKELLAMNTADNHNLPKTVAKSVRVYGFRGYRQDDKRRRTERTYLYSYFDKCENYRNVFVHAIYINGELKNLNMIRFPKKLDPKGSSEIQFRVPRYVDVLKEPEKILYLPSSSQDSNKRLGEGKCNKSRTQDGHRKRKSNKLRAKDVRRKHRKEKFRVSLNEDSEETSGKLKTGKILMFSKDDLRKGIEAGNLKLNEVLTGVKNGSFDISEALMALCSYIDRNYDDYVRSRRAKRNKGKVKEKEEEGGVEWEEEKEKETEEEGGIGGEDEEREEEEGGIGEKEKERERKAKKKKRVKKVKGKDSDIIESGIERCPYEHPPPRLLRFLKKFNPKTAGEDFWKRVPMPLFKTEPNRKKYNPLKLPKMTDMEREWVLDRYHRRMAEQSHCIEEIKLHMRVFDNRMDKLLRESHDVNASLMLLELQRTQVIKQINILKTFEKGEAELDERLKQMLEEWQKVMQKVNQAQSVINKHQRAVEKLLDEDKAIVDLFNETISNNKYADYLLKIFRRIEEVTEVKKKESDEGDSTSTGSSTEGEDEETIRQRRMKLDPKVCPEGLSKEIYLLAFTLRDKRAEIEEKVAIQKAEIAALMLAFEEVDKERRNAEENLKEAQENIAKAERSKKSSMDNVECVVPLSLDQLGSEMYGDNFQWADCGTFLDVDLSQVEEEIDEDEIAMEEEGEEEEEEEEEKENKGEDEEEKPIVGEEKVEEIKEETEQEMEDEEGEEKKSQESTTEATPPPDETDVVDEGVLISSDQLLKVLHSEDKLRKEIEDTEEMYRADKEALEEMRKENRKMERDLLKEKQQLKEKMIETVGSVFPIEIGHIALLVSEIDKVKSKAHKRGRNYQQELNKLEKERKIQQDNLSRVLQENTDKLYCLSVLEEMSLKAERTLRGLEASRFRPTDDRKSKYEKEVRKMQCRIKRQHQEMLLLRQEIKTLSLKTTGPPPITPRPPPKPLKESSAESSVLEPLGPDQEDVSIRMVPEEEFLEEEIVREELQEDVLGLEEEEEEEKPEDDEGEEYLPIDGDTEEGQEGQEGQQDTEDESDIVPKDDMVMQIIQSIPFIESDIREFLDRVVDELGTTDAETHVKSILDDVIHELTVPLEENEGLEEKFSVVLDKVDRSSMSKEHIAEVRSILQDVILKSTQVADTSDEGASELEDEVNPETEEPSVELE